MALSGGNNPTVLPTFGYQLSGWVLLYNIYPQPLFGFPLMNQSVRITLGHTSCSLTPHADLQSIECDLCNTACKQYVLPRFDDSLVEKASDYPHGLPVESEATSLGNVGSSTE